MFSTSENCVLQLHEAGGSSGRRTDSFASATSRLGASQIQSDISSAEQTIDGRHVRSRIVPQFAFFVVRILYRHVQSIASGCGAHVRNHRRVSVTRCRHFSTRFQRNQPFSAERLSFTSKFTTRSYQTFAECFFFARCQIALIMKISLIIIFRTLLFAFYCRLKLSLNRFWANSFFRSFSFVETLQRSPVKKHLNALPVDLVAIILAFVRPRSRNMQ